MADIIERLETFGDAHSWAVRGDAADEIRRLRAQLSVAMEEKQKQVNYWGDRCCKAEAQRDRLLAALKQIAIGGNHLATHRTDRWPSYGTEPADALAKLGAGQEYDMWCCWAAIMTARAAIAA